MDTSIVDDYYVKSTALRRWGIAVKRTGSQHWNGPCPKCGGKDRFYIGNIGHCQCNQCDASFFLDDDKPFEHLDPLEIIRRADEQRRKEKELTEQRWRDWSNGFLAGYYWREWHKQMSQENIEWWLAKGLTRRQINYYELGYMPEKQVWVNDKPIVLPAYTIPVRNLDWEICNIHYRLVNPPEGCAKYRYETGIPAREFYATPKKHKVAIVVEGGIKASVVYRYVKGTCQVVGLTTCSPSQVMMERTRIFDDVILMLDPGCERQSERFKAVVPQTRICALPGKPDDLLLGGMTMSEFKSFIPRRAHV